MFDEITDRGRVEALERAIAFLDSQRLNWNDRYIGTTTPTQEYSGTYVGRQGTDFMIRTQTEIFIGHTADIPAKLTPGRPSLSRLKPGTTQPKLVSMRVSAKESPFRERAPTGGNVAALISIADGRSLEALERRVLTEADLTFAGETASG